MTMNSLNSLIDNQQAEHSLDQVFYLDDAIYNQDLEQVFMSDWLYICHESQVAAAGDCYTYDIADESVIVVRDENLRLNAFANVCRHRGSRICDAGQSSHKRLICPYHAWTYGLNGQLLSARLMDEGFDKSVSGLKQLHLEQFCGLIFVSFSEQPPSFEMLKTDLTPPLKVFDIANTRVAHHEVHPTHANWKLVLENFNECYHCGPAHKEFSASHSLMLDKERQRAFDELIAERAPQAGISADTVGFMQTDKKALTNAPYYYDRYALFKGYLTGSEDGQPVAPLLGEVRQYDGGASNVQLGNLTYLLVYADHVVLYRFTPRAVNLTDAELIWFVRSDADLENDVDIERMIWLWNVTTMADKDIIERNQKGVQSRFYKPGPYSPMETFTINFIKWYLNTLKS